MKRRSISPRKHARKFNKTRNKHKALNSPTMVMRGGRRL